jgi:hypothetical protein
MSGQSPYMSTAQYSYPTGYQQVHLENIFLLILNKNFCLSVMPVMRVIQLSKQLWH